MDNVKAYDQDFSFQHQTQQLHTSAGATFCPEPDPREGTEQRVPFVSAMPNWAQPILIEQLFPIQFQGSKLAADFLQAHTGL